MSEIEFLKNEWIELKNWKADREDRGMDTSEYTRKMADLEADIMEIGGDIEADREQRMILNGGEE